MIEDWRNGGFGLYVHWPFCASKCPYCDFNSHVAARIDQPDWAAAYEAEIARLAAETGPRVLNSIFFGGGTPSLMEVETVGRVLDAAAGAWTFANDIEITLEANPGSVEAARFAGYRAAGVNRVSLGVQALNDPDLRRLGRLHDVAEARAAVALAQSVFDRVSFDLIYARQDQTIAAWETELQQAIAMAGEHLSVYQLTIEDGTAFGARHAAGGLRGLPDDDVAADMYLITQDILEYAGLPAYEVSNHARPGAESRHNLIYWRGGDYAGVGPGAHGRLTLGGRRFATEAPKAPGAWLAEVKAGRAGEHPREALSTEDRASEYLMMGLRLREGIDLDRHAAILGRGLDPAAMERLAEIGVAERDDTYLRLTRAGRPVLNAVLRDLLA